MLSRTNSGPGVRAAVCKGSIASTADRSVTNNIIVRVQAKIYIAVGDRTSTEVLGKSCVVQNILLDRSGLLLFIS